MDNIQGTYNNPSTLGPYIVLESISAPLGVCSSNYSHVGAYGSPNPSTATICLYTGTHLLLSGGKQS